METTAASRSARPWRAFGSGAGPHSARLPCSRSECHDPTKPISLIADLIQKYRQIYPARSRSRRADHDINGTVTTMRIEQAHATRKNMKAVLRLIGEASSWLGTKGTDQWAGPWPNRRKRNVRVGKGLKVGGTWIVWDGKTPVATVTIARSHNPAVWAVSDCDLSESAGYAHRLIVAREYADRGPEPQLIDWAGLQGHARYGAKWIRIDAWTGNTMLHDYYMRTGFAPCGRCPDPDYPSGALFQKPVRPGP